MHSPAFKEEAGKQVTEGGHEVMEVAKRLGNPTDKNLYFWVLFTKQLHGVRIKQPMPSCEFSRANPCHSG